MVRRRIAPVAYRRGCSSYLDRDYADEQETARSRSQPRVRTDAPPAARLGNTARSTERSFARSRDAVSVIDDLALNLRRKRSPQILRIRR